MKQKLFNMKRDFTLVEIMVAMAILVILMGFLFEFVIGAQQIWAASRNVSGLYDRAQIAMRWLEKDLQASIYQDDVEYPGRGLGFALKKTENNVSLKMLLASESVKGGYGPLVEYKYVQDPGRLGGSLYRLEYDSSHAMYKAFVNPELPPVADPVLLAEDKLADGLLSFEVMIPRPTSPATAAYDSNVKPPFVKVNMVIFDTNMIPKVPDETNSEQKKVLEDFKEKNSRTFSKFIFMNDRKSL